MSQKIETNETNDPSTFDRSKKLMIVVECEKVNTLDEVRRLRKELNDALTAVIRNFENRSGCIVEAVQPRVGEGAYWKVEVKL